MICPDCRTEYVLHHFKMPFKDNGDTLYCRCGTELFSYGKGTDDYSIEEIGAYKARMKKLDYERARLEEERNLFVTVD